MTVKNFKIHGDNIVECKRALEYIIEALHQLTTTIKGPSESITCPTFSLKLNNGETYNFQFLPGYGSRRWQHDILGHVQARGGRLREATDVIITQENLKSEEPIIAFEFCGALPAGNQAWQRQGRAFSYAHAGIPFFYIAELGGFELSDQRDKKSERMPNPAIPFSFITATINQKSDCLPVYEANLGASNQTFERYAKVFGRVDFIHYIRAIMTGKPTKAASQVIAKKCASLIGLLAESKKRSDGLTKPQWEQAELAVEEGSSLTDYLKSEAKLPWSKKAYIDGLTASSKKFMELGSKYSQGLTSSSMPLSFIPKKMRKAFSKEIVQIFPDLNKSNLEWLSKDKQDLVISWIMGFKPGGDDARPDRGLTPLAKMLVGDSAEILTFIYGPAPSYQFRLLRDDPDQLAKNNGLWEAILASSDAIIIDSKTLPSNVTRFHIKNSWGKVLAKTPTLHNTNARVLTLGEHDVDTAIHISFQSLGEKICFEGLCNPPGGDWSGISLKCSPIEDEHRWLTLPRVTKENAKRPDHVFSLFTNKGELPICIAIESKEAPTNLDMNIGGKLIEYVESLFETPPGIVLKNKEKKWAQFKGKWKKPGIKYASAGAFLCEKNNSFAQLPAETGLDFAIGVSFSSDAKNCVLNLKGITSLGKEVVRILSTHKTWSDLITIKICN